MTDGKNEGFLDKVKGRVKQAAGDLAGDSQLKSEGSKEENRGEAKEELSQAEDQVGQAEEKVHEKAREVKNRS